MPFEIHEDKGPRDHLVICDVEYRKGDWIQIQFKTTKDSRLRIVRSLAKVKGFISGGPDNVGGMYIKDIDGEEFTVLVPNIHEIKKRLGSIV
jgi:hypothetical protein